MTTEHEPVGSDDNVDEESVHAPDALEGAESPETHNGFAEDDWVTQADIEDSKKVAAPAPKETLKPLESLDSKRQRLKEARLHLPAYADPAAKEVLRTHIHALSTEIINQENIEYQDETGQDLEKKVARRLPEVLKRATEAGKQVLSPEEYRQELLPGVEEDLRNEDRKEAEAILRRYIINEYSDLADDERRRFFDAKGNLKEEEFRQYFKEALVESQVSETSFCKMLSMGYRLDLLDDNVGFWTRLTTMGAKYALPTEGGRVLHYKTEDEFNRFVDFTREQKEVLKEEARRRVSIELYHEDGSEITEAEIRNAFIAEEVEIAQNGYWDKLPKKEKGAIIAKKKKSRQGSYKGDIDFATDSISLEDIKAYLEDTRRNLNLSREAFYMMINMGYKIDPIASHSLEFHAWMEQKAQQDIENETRARQAIVKKYEFHYENRQLLINNIRRELLAEKGIAKEPLKLKKTAKPKPVKIEAPQTLEEKAMAAAKILIEEYLNENDTAGLDEALNDKDNSPIYWIKDKKERAEFRKKVIQEAKKRMRTRSGK